MFSRKKEPTQLERAIDRALRELTHHEIDSEEYAKKLEMVIKLHGIKDRGPEPVSKDTLAIVGANLLGIVMIIKHEYVNVVTSRAMSLILKPR